MIFVEVFHYLPSKAPPSSALLSWFALSPFSLRPESSPNLGDKLRESESRRLCPRFSVEIEGPPLVPPVLFLFVLSLPLV